MKWLCLALNYFISLISFNNVRFYNLKLFDLVLENLERVSLLQINPLLTDVQNVTGIWESMEVYNLTQEV